MRHTGDLAHSRCKESVGPSLLNSTPLDTPFWGLCTPAPSVSILPSPTRHTPLRGQWPHMPEPEDVLPFIQGWAELDDRGQLLAGCPTDEPSSPPTAKAQNSGKECVCWGWVGRPPGSWA